MRRYIDAEDVEKRIDIVMGSEPKAWDKKALRELKMYVVHAVPTADVVEVDKVNKIYEKLADLFDIPCNYSPCDEIMSESERCMEDCGNIPDAECWKRYFEVVCDGEKVGT